MNLSPAKEDDRKVLFEVHREVFGPHIEQIWGWDEEWQRTNFAAEFNSTDTSVIEVDGSVAGYFQVRDEPDRIFLQNIALSSEFQGKGVGAELVEQLQQRAATRGVALDLSVFRTNSSAQRFYKRCGFWIVGKTDAFVEMSWNREDQAKQDRKL